jgi:CelD/BcsL family acetyltransferase involved in cellulose biosynthesis
VALTITREELPALRDAWCGLIERTAEPIPFVHPTWQQVWLDEFLGDRELLLFAARDGEQLAGIAPLIRDGGTLSFVGHYSICDYMDIVAPEERTRDVVAALFAAIDGEPWSQMELRGLRASSPALEAFTDAAGVAGLRVEREEEAVAPRVQDGASWEEFLGGLSKKNRHELRRKLRRLQAAGELELHTYTSRVDVEEHLPLLLRFMVESRSDKASFMSEQMGRFFHRMAPALANEGLVRLFELELDTKPVASILSFDMAGRLFMYNSGYDPDYAGLAVGLGSKALCLREAIESGYRCLDFLRGQESYKYDLGAVDQQVYKLTIARG